MKMQWVTAVASVALAACVGTEGQEPPTAPTSTQIVEMTAGEVQLAADGKYYIPDRGDGCAYFETGRTPEITYEGGVLPAEVMLWADGCEIGWHYEPSTGHIGPTVR